MLDWSRKSLIKKFHYSTINEDRECSKTVIIKGREYIKQGVECATTAVALMYKVYDPSVKRNKTAILVGIARQNPGDLYISEEEGVEIASENAFVNPVATIIYNETPDWEAVYCILRSYVAGLPIRMIKTSDELVSLGKDPKKFKRTVKEVNKYYNDYYNDCLRLGLMGIS